MDVKPRSAFAAFLAGGARLLLLLLLLLLLVEDEDATLFLFVARFCFSAAAGIFLFCVRFFLRGLLFGFAPSLFDDVSDDV